MSHAGQLFIIAIISAAVCVILSIENPADHEDLASEIDRAAVIECRQ